MIRILLADDQELVRTGFRVVLDAEQDFEVVGEAADGNQAVEQYQALKPDVCTMDITMPEKDGIQALKDILAADPAARVVMCSALGQEAKVIESIRAGAKDFIVKPFQPDRVLEAVQKALA